jgi:hypothetical protein
MSQQDFDLTEKGTGNREIFDVDFHSESLP